MPDFERFFGLAAGGLAGLLPDGPAVLLVLLLALLMARRPAARVVADGLARTALRAGLRGLLAERLRATEDSRLVCVEVDWHKRVAASYNLQARRPPGPL